MSALNGTAGPTTLIGRSLTTAIVAPLLLLGCAKAAPDAAGTIGSEAVPAELASVAVTDTVPDNLSEPNNRSGQDARTEGGEPPAPGTDIDIGDLPSFAAIDALLADFSICLNEAGVSAPTVSLEDILAKVPDLPIDAGRDATFSHFYGLDASDPTVEAALVGCDHLFDDPAVSVFIPAP